MLDSQPEGEPVSEKEIPFHPDSSSHRPVRETEAEVLMVGGNTPRPGLLGDTHLTLVPFKQEPYLRTPEMDQSPGGVHWTSLLFFSKQPH